MEAPNSRIDSLVQYALLLAGERDEFAERLLGPIHLIKYVYLADLAYAARNDGQSFTGVRWQFYRFGPWSQTVNERIAPALQALGADRRDYRSDYEEKGEWSRWSMRDDGLLAQREQQLPAPIKFALRNLVKKYGQDTSSLLHHVYRTEPMLGAAPEEYLDLKLAVRAPAERVVEEASRLGQLTAKQRKTLDQRLRETRERIRAQRQPRKLIDPAPEARYDAVFDDGVKWLDRLAGEPPPAGEQTAEFSDDVWKSSPRKGRESSH